MMDLVALQKLSQDITKSHENSVDSQIQTQIFMRCMQLLLLSDFEDELHLFCNPDLEVISGHTLIMFSFPGTTSVPRQVIEARFERSLLGCSKCVCAFYECLAQIRSRFILVRKISVAQVIQFLDIVNDWLSIRLHNQLQRLQDGTLGDSEKTILLYGCLSNASLLRKDPTLRSNVAAYLDKIDPKDANNFNTILSSTVFYLIEGNDTEYQYAQKVVTSLERGTCSLNKFTVDELCYHFYRLQDSAHFTPAFSIRFWSMILALLKACDKSEIEKLLKPPELEAMSAHTKIRLSPIIRVLFNNLMAGLDSPLPVLLQVLDMFLELYGVNLWKKAEECHCSFILETVPSNPNFIKHLRYARINQDSESYSALLRWVIPFVQSLTGSQKQISIVKLSNAFISMENDNESDPVLQKLSIDLLLLVLNSSSEQGTKDSISLLKTRDIRFVVEKNCSYFLKLARNDFPNAQEVVKFCLEYDVAVMAHNAAIIDKKEIPTLSEPNSKLWDELKQIPITNFDYALNILKAFGDVSQVVIFKEKKNVQISQELQAAIKIQERDAKNLTSNISFLLEKLTFLEPEQLKLFLTHDDGMQSLWSCIFNTETSSSALSIVSLIQDSEGRYEALVYLLDHSLTSSLHSLSNSISNITQLKFYEPCPKTLRILMDVIRSLTDPLSGILNTQVTSHLDSKSEIKRFWVTSWLLLDMIYKQTLIWANFYHLSDLIEFTRDALDTSHLLLDSFRVLLDFFSDETLVGSLFEPFMTTFTNVIVWLRLGDLSLLKSCVELVFKGFDLAKELNVKVDKNFLVSFAKYGAKAKKFNNKLTIEQRDMVLAKASEFDAILVSQVVEDAARERNPIRLISPTVPKEQTLTGAKFNYQSQKPKELKQINLSRFGIVTSKPPVAPPPPPPSQSFKPNNLEAIRNELKSNRSSVKVPAAAPAAARPAGFNNKAPVVGRSLNALKPRKEESDSSEDENDVDTSDLFYDSKKKTKITELDISGKPITKVAVAKKVDKEKKEEERMRLRLNVNLKPLYSTILKWNYNSNSEFPTDNRDCYKEKAEQFSSAKDYNNQIEPLLMLECWQGIQASRTTGQELAFELLVGSRTTCDGFFDVYLSVKRSILQERKVGESDLLVLGYVADKGLVTPQEITRCLKEPGTQTCLGKVRQVKHANPDYSDITIRVFPQGLMMGLLTPKSVVVGMKVIQMVTLEREYSSLQGLQYYDLCDDILAAKPSPPVTITPQQASIMCQKLGVNESQAAAIIGSSQSEGFSLIQGPPGTGKTKTILGVVGHFISKVENSSSNAIQAPVGISQSSTNPEDAKPVAKVLICAPSNAAVDELVLRLKDGVFKENGERYIPKVIRLGKSDAMNAAVRDISLEELVDRHLRERNDQVAINPNIRQEHTKCLAERDRIRQELKRNPSDAQVLELEKSLREVNKKRSELGKLLDEQREQVSVAYRSREIERRRIQAKLINEAQVICSTLSGSAHDFLASMYIKFDQVIIDEACQCVELSAIIPLRYGCKRCVMVGDPNQLPPTVLSQKAAALKYEESLFVRMQRNYPKLVYLLDVQYRMHPDISQFPSLEFYHSRLSDGPGMLEKNTRPWHQNPVLSPYRFFDIVSRHQQNDRSKSFFNQTESMVALELVEKLMEVLPGKQFAGKVGVISPYKEQIRNLRDVFQRKFGATILREIDFNTVDGFQGQEKEIIIMSCVRASETGSVGFLSDVRRMNVALTRARTTLWVLGNKTSLARDKIWKKLINNAESRHCVSSARPGFTLKIDLQYNQISRTPSGITKNISVIDRRSGSSTENTTSSSYISDEIPSAIENTELNGESDSPLASTERKNGRKRSLDTDIYEPSSKKALYQGDAGHEKEVKSTKPSDQYKPKQPSTGKMFKNDLDAKFSKNKSSKKKVFVYDLKASNGSKSDTTRTESLKREQPVDQPKESIVRDTSTHKKPKQIPGRPKMTGSSIFIQKRRPNSR